jgi:aspartate aminotransferase
VIRIASRVAAIPEAATFALKARAQALRAQGRDVVDLSVGEPDGSPPEAALAAARESLDRGEHRYAPVAGIPELREAIAARYRRLHGIPAEPANVLVTIGGKQALHDLSLTLFEPGDEVLIPTPCWISYVPQLELAGVRVRCVPSRWEEGFQPDVDALAAAVGPKTRAIYLNSPGNPTGVVLEAERLHAIDRLAAERGLLVVSDEIYGAITYDGRRHPCAVALSDDARLRTIVVDAVSKTFAMAGWRLGWMLAPKSVIAACSALQGHVTSGVAPVVQRAAVGALSAGPDYTASLVDSYRQRRDALYDGLSGLDGLDPGLRPMGAFYLFPRVDGLFGRRRLDGSPLKDARGVADWLLDSAGVAAIPGDAFGEPRCIRFSYATDIDRLRTAAERVRDALNSLR